MGAPSLALLVASQLTSCAPTLNAKLYAASQTFDEARHVECFNKYLQTKAGYMYPVDPALKEISVTFSKDMLTDRMWAVVQTSKTTLASSGSDQNWT